MVGRWYAFFDTAVGRCAMVWSEAGVVAVQLPEIRELETRRRIYRAHPEAREQALSGEIAAAAKAVAGVLRGLDGDLRDIRLDMSGMPDFQRRVYAAVQAIPRGDTRTCSGIARELGASGAWHSVAQAIGRNPFMTIVPCHRVMDGSDGGVPLSPYRGVISRRRLLSIEGASPMASRTLFDALLPVARPRPAP